MLTIDLVLVLLALISFLVATAGVVVPRVNLVALGLALWMLSLLLSTLEGVPPTAHSVGAPDGTHGLTAAADGTLSADRVVSFEMEPSARAWSRCAIPVSGRYLTALEEAACAARGLPRYSATWTGDAAHAWEEWTVVPHGRGIALQSCWSTWLSMQEGGDVKGAGLVLVNGPTPGPWEELIPTNPAAFGLTSDGGNTGQGGGGCLERPRCAGRPGLDRPLVWRRDRPADRAWLFGLRRAQEVPRGSRSDARPARPRRAGRPAVRARAVAAQRRVLDRFAASPTTRSAIRGGRTRCAAFLEACRDRGLRVNLTSGDFYNWTDAAGGRQLPPLRADCRQRVARGRVAGRRGQRAARRASPRRRR